MAFRDDHEATRARSEALERENRELREKLAAAQGRREQGGQPFRRATGPLVGAGVAIFALAAWLGATQRVPLVVLPAAAALGMFAITIGVVARLVHVVGPNEALVILGRRHRQPDGRVLGYRAILGGRALTIPFIEVARWLGLGPYELSLELDGALARDGKQLALRAIAAVSVTRVRDDLYLAVERFLDRDPAEISATARQILEVTIRAAVASHTLDDLSLDRERTNQLLREGAREELGKLGLTLDTFQVQSMDET